jgi:glutathione S-transferase
MPYLIAPDANGEFTVAKSDTTPIISFLDKYQPDRPLRPIDPALQFLDLLIEDYGDEWLSKCMFHYRWNNAEDTRRAAAYLPYAFKAQMTSEEGAQAAAVFAKRQISRIGVVGSNEITAPVIESSWRRFLEIFEAHTQHTPYLMGNRPGAGDFACYGQMTMLVITDPTPSRTAFDVSPRAYAWTEKCEDLSGLDVTDSDWIDIDNPPETLLALLKEIGRVYAPFLIGNASAIARGLDRVECEIDGQPWVQSPFVYQAKCLTWLQDAYGRLQSSDRTRVDRVLVDTGCEALLEGA